ncbi:MAG: hypothetical protein KJ622_10985 [Alphaproteobacteria bacterium]|nr:hypothetical protein [Alphaproteobacteria bacterium]
MIEPGFSSPARGKKSFSFAVAPRWQTFDRQTFRTTILEIANIDFFTFHIEPNVIRIFKEDIALSEINHYERLFGRHDRLRSQKLSTAD